MQNTRYSKRQAVRQDGASGRFRDQIWEIIESWKKRLISEKDGDSWRRVSEIQLVGNLPAILRGISRAIENSKHMADFGSDGIIRQISIEMGKKRRLQRFTAAEVLYEQEVLRDVIWDTCREIFLALDSHKLGQRVNQAFDKASSMIANGYIDAYATELKYLAHRDKLTDFFNYEFFKEAIDYELKRSKRSRHSFSLILLDIDGFRSYSNGRGGLGGDMLVQEVSGIIAQTIRGVDIPARYGADEFAIIFPETSKKHARSIAERLRKAIKLEAGRSIRTQVGQKPVITVSIGISSYPEDADMID